MILRHPTQQSPCFAKGILRFLVASGFAFSVIPCWATTSAEANAFAGYVIYGGNPPEVSGDSGPNAAIAYADYSGDIPNPPFFPIISGSSAAAAALANYGVIKAGANGVAVRGGLANSSASGYYDDTFIIGNSNSELQVRPTWNFSFSGEGLNDSASTLSFMARLGTGSSYSEITAIVSVSDSAPSFDGTITTSVNGAITQSKFSTTGTFTMPPIPYFTGEVLTVVSQVTVGGSTVASALQSTDLGYMEGSYSISAMNSAYWGGIEVLDAAGQDVGDISVVSASGTDWNQSFIPAVPELSTWFYLAVGGFGLWGHAASRRTRPDCHQSDALFRRSMVAFKRWGIAAP